MPTTLPVVSLPDSLAAGDSWRVSVAIAGYAPADGWTAATLFLHGAQVVKLTGEADGTTGWTFTAGATSTTAIQPGRYRAALRVTMAASAQTLQGTDIDVTPDVATAAPDAFLSHEERAIPLLVAAIEKRVTIDMKAYTITNTQATREELREMVAMLGRYRAAVTMQRNGGRLPPYRFSFGRS